MIGNLSAKDVLLKFYDEDSDLFKLLWHHSCQVAEMALDIASRFPEADQDFVYDASLLHDVGIIKTHAPSIFCNGDEPYIRHGILGAEMLRGIDASMEPYARVCERHTGAGISAAEIERDNLPLPHRDMIPVTLEEKIVCYAENRHCEDRRQHSRGSLQVWRRPVGTFRCYERLAESLTAAFYKTEPPAIPDCRRLCF